MSAAAGKGAAGKGAAGKGVTTQREPEPLSCQLRMTLGAIDLDVSLSLAPAQTTALYGPSGAGKSSLFRVLAGLETRAAGTVHCGAECWQDSAVGRFVPAHQRQLGLVFQAASLFSHLTVADNLRYAVKRSRGRSGPSLAEPEVCAVLELEALLERPVAALSGGEQRRVALARALLSRPRWLLLDEPLVGLDGARRARILDYLADLTARLGLSTLLITHQPDEVARLAEQVVLLERGGVSAMGTAQTVLGTLTDRRYDVGSLLEGALRSEDRELLVARVAVGASELLVPLRHDADSAPPGQRVRLYVRAADVALAVQPPVGLSIRNLLPARITTLTEVPRSPFAELSLDLDGQTLKARITRAAVQDLGLTQQQSVFALIKAVSFAPRDAAEWTGFEAVSQGIQ